MEIIKKIFKRIYNIFKEFLKDDIKVEKDGLIFVGRTKINRIDLTYMTNIIIKVIKKVIKKSYNDLIKLKDSKDFDEVIIYLNVLITFDTKEGFRATEKNILTHELDISDPNYNEINYSLKKKLIDLFDRYNIISVEKIIVKIF